MKTISSVLITTAAGVIINLISNYFAPAANRNKKLVVLLFILILIFSICLNLLPDSTGINHSDYSYLWIDLDPLAVFIIVIGAIGSSYYLYKTVNYGLSIFQSLPIQPDKRRRRHHRSKDHRSKILLFLQNSPKFFFVSGVGVVIFITLTGIGIYYQQYKFEHAPFRVLVANFDGIDPEQYRVTEYILSRLQQELESYSDVKIEALNQSITVLEGNSTKARDIGKQHRASLVIWGWYGVTPSTVSLSVHFEVICTLRCYPHLKSNVKGEQQIFPLSELESFTLQSELSNQMTVLSLFIVGLAQYSKDKWSDAIDSFTKAILQPNKEVYSEIYYYRGMAYLAINKHELALADFDQVIKLDPNYANAYNNRSIIYAIQDHGNIERAVKEVSKAIAIAPNNGSFYHSRGVLYLDKQEGELALPDFNKAIELEPNEARYYKDRGMAYYQTGDYDIAAKDLEQALALFDKDRESYKDKDMLEEIARAHIYYGEIYAVFGEYDEALKHLNQGIALKNDYANAYYLRSGLYYQERNFTEATSDLERALSLGLDKDREQEALQELDAIQKGIPLRLQFGQ